MQIKAFIQEYSLNQSLPQRYFAFLWQVIHGNLGFSFKQNESVDAIVLQDLRKTPFGRLVPSFRSHHRSSSRDAAGGEA